MSEEELDFFRVTFTVQEVSSHTENHYFIFQIIQNCISYTDKNNDDFYIRFLLDTSRNVGTYDYQPLIGMIFSELKQFAEAESNFSPATLAEIYLCLGTYEKNPSQKKHWLVQAEECTLDEAYKDKNNGLLLSNIYNQFGYLFYRCYRDYAYAHFWFEIALKSNPKIDYESISVQTQNLLITAAALESLPHAISQLEYHIHSIQSTPGIPLSVHASFCQAISILYFLDGQFDQGTKYAEDSLGLYSLVSNKQMDFLMQKCKEIISMYKFCCKIDNSDKIENILSEIIRKNLTITPQA